MRNSRTAFLVTALLAIGFAAGCSADQSTRENLTAGFTSLENPSSDREYTDSLARADSQLAKNPQGAGSAEALYLRGRALEARVKHSDDQGRSDLQAARQAYTEALTHNPVLQLQQYLHTSLGNISYWQSDYPTAIAEWSQVVGKTSDDSLSAFCLYRIGLCHQRMGNFSTADQTFTQVGQKFPNSEASVRAQQHIGFKFFLVQLATYADAKLADASVRQLSQSGVTAQHQVDRSGKHIVSVGPASNYVQAQQLLSRFAGQFPNAVIVP